MWDTLEIRFALEARQDLELSEGIFKFCYHNRKSGGMKTKKVRLTRRKERFLVPGFFPKVNIDPILFDQICQ